MHKLIIVTADKRTLAWPTLPAKLRAIKNTLNTIRNANFTVDIVHEEFMPEVVEGRITRAWFEDFATPYFTDGYDFVVVHLKDTQRKKWGIKPTLRGSQLNTETDMGLAYFWADEDTKRERLNQFIQTCLHEISHAFVDGAGIVDTTHAWHDTTPDIRGLFSTYDMDWYQPKRMDLKAKKGWLESLLGIAQEAHEIRLILAARARLQPLVARKVDEVVHSMAMLGHPIRITSAYRSYEEQQALYDQGRSTPGRVVTKAKPGESLHNHGMAVDIVFRNEGYEASEALWQTLGAVAESHGFEWGGSDKWRKARFVDRPHLQMTLGYSLKDFKAGTVDYSRFN